MIIYELTNGSYEPMTCLDGSSAGAEALCGGRHYYRIR